MMTDAIDSIEVKARGAFKKALLTAIDNDNKPALKNMVAGAIEEKDAGNTLLIDVVKKLEININEALSFEEEAPSAE